AFAAHRLDQDRQVQLAAPGYLELVGVVRVLDLQRNVVLGFAGEAVTYLARSQELAAAVLLLSGEGRVVDLEGHADRRFVDREYGQLLDCGRVAEGFRDAELLDTRSRNDVASLRLGHFMSLETVEAQNLENLALPRLAFAIDHRDLGVRLD